MRPGTHVEYRGLFRRRGDVRCSPLISLQPPRRCPHHRAEVVDAAVLLVSELVTNAVRHASPPIIVEVICETSHSLQVRVSDATPEPPWPGRPGVHDEGGRGLAITEVLSDEWGVDPTAGDGKTVWFRIDNSG